VVVVYEEMGGRGVKYTRLGHGCTGHEGGRHVCLGTYLVHFHVLTHVGTLCEGGFATYCISFEKVPRVRLSVCCGARRATAAAL